MSTTTTDPEPTTTESQTFTWELESFSSLAEPKDTSYFYSNNVENKFFLRLYPQYEIRHLLNHVAVYLHRGPPYSKDLSVVYKVAVIDANGERRFAEEIKTDFNDKNKGVPANGGLFYLSRDYLLDRANRLLANDRLTIFCEVEVLGTESSPESNEFSSSTTTEPNELTEEGRKVIADLDSLLQSGKFADVTLVVDGREYPVHRAVLAARSAVFESMFENESLEMSKGKLELTDVPEMIMDPLLRYIYTGRVPPLDQLASELFVAADKYQLESLRTIAEDHLASTLTVESVVDVLLLADMHSACKLKQVCIKYITENARAVMQTTAWEQMGQKRPLLLMQLYKDLVVQIKM